VYALQRYGWTCSHSGEGCGRKEAPVRNSTGAPGPYLKRAGRHAHNPGLPHCAVFGSVLQCTQYHVPCRQDCGRREATERAWIAAEGG
jgi:hypothetical protein